MYIILEYEHLCIYIINEISYNMKHCDSKIPKIVTMYMLYVRVKNSIIFLSLYHGDIEI